MCVHWYFAEHSSELSYRLFSKSKGRILDDELRYSFNIKRVWHFPQIFLILSSRSQLPWSNYAKVRKNKPQVVFIEREFLKERRETLKNVKQKKINKADNFNMQRQLYARWMMSRHKLMSMYTYFTRRLGAEPWENLKKSVWKNSFLVKFQL